MFGKILFRSRFVARKTITRTPLNPKDPVRRRGGGCAMGPTRLREIIIRSHVQCAFSQRTHNGFSSRESVYYTGMHSTHSAVLHNVTAKGYGVIIKIPRDIMGYTWRILFVESRSVHNGWAGDCAQGLLRIARSFYGAVCIGNNRDAAPLCRVPRQTAQVYELFTIEITRVRLLWRSRRLIHRDLITIN